MPLISALRRQRQRQVNICEVETTLVYKSQDRLQSHRETLSRNHLPSPKKRKKRKRKEGRKKRRKKEKTSKKY
ncbi:hypothetical protein ACQP3L_30180, partial [Escherichia coli]